MLSSDLREHATFSRRGSREGDLIAKDLYRAASELDSLGAELNSLREQLATAKKRAEAAEAKPCVACEKRAAEHRRLEQIVLDE